MFAVDSVMPTTVYDCNLRSAVVYETLDHTVCFNGHRQDMLYS